MKRPARASASKILFLAGVCLSLEGCGTHAPSLSDTWEPAELTDELVYRIQKSIYCELRQAVSKHSMDITLGRRGVIPAIPDDWGAQLTLSLTVDESTGVNPTAAFNDVLRDATSASASKFGQSFNLPFSAGLSSQAVRKDTYYSFYLAKGLKFAVNEGGDTACGEYSHSDEKDEKIYPLDRHGSSYLLTGNIGIDRWLSGALLATNAVPSSENLSKKADVLQYDIKFVVATSASVNPALKLVSFFLGGSAPFLTTGRTKTHELLLTFGPSETIAGKVVPSQPAQSVHFSGEIYSAVASGFRSVLTNPP